MSVPIYRIDPATGQTVIQYPDGTVVPVLGGQSSAPMDSGSSLPSDAPATETSSGAGNGYADYAPRRTARSYDYSAQPPSFGSSYPTDLPAYADGSYPGQPRTPGGRAAELSQYDDYRAPLSVPAGNSVGTYGGSHDGGGGGGGSSLYWAWRNKLEGKLYPGSSDSSYSSSSYGSYPEPKAPKMHGEYAKGLDPAQAAGLAYRPSAMIPTVFPHLGGATPLYQQLSGLPAYPLAILSKKHWSGSPSSTANAVGNFYEKVGEDDWMPSADKLIKNLGQSKGVNEMFGGVKAKGGGYEYGKEPLGMGEAAYTLQGMLDSVLQSTLPQETALKYSSYGNWLIDKASSKALKKPAGKGATLNRTISRRLFR